MVCRRAKALRRRRLWASFTLLKASRWTPGRLWLWSCCWFFRVVSGGEVFCLAVLPFWCCPPALLWKLVDVTGGLFRWRSIWPRGAATRCLSPSLRAAVEACRRPCVELRVLVALLSLVLLFFLLCVRCVCSLVFAVPLLSPYTLVHLNLSCMRLQSL